MLRAPPSRDVQTVKQNMFLVAELHLPETSYHDWLKDAPLAEMCNVLWR
ncbi:hypothetical protein IQ268_04950 [Oculatella sp. LEGE 06141]|nr:hypothetical protein [Oculatella sp. LEGE 06141]MBE9177931.1 hypothetical protein [Oculatella sp. LEGE 06141]